MNQLKLSIMQTFDQLRLTEMELDMLAHAASLTPQQIADNNKASQPIPRSEMQPLSVTHIGPEDMKKLTAAQQKLPYMVRPSDEDAAQQATGGQVV